MSIIYNDKSLLNELIRLAQAAAPASAVPTDDSTKVKSLALKLLSNLDSQVNSTHKFTSDKDSSMLRMNNLQSVNELLNFLHSDMIKYNGIPLALRHDKMGPGQGIASGVGDTTFAGLDKTVQDQYVKYPQPDASDPDNFRYWVNKNGIITYIQDLQKKAKDTDNRLMEAILGKLSQQIKDQIGIDTSQKAVEQQVAANVSLDNILNTVVVQAPYELGQISIYPKDLANKAAFWNFLKSNNISLKNGDTVKKTDDFDGTDMCTVAQVLQMRAKRNFDRSDDANAKTYYNLVTALLSTLQCATGATTTQQSSTQQAGYVTQQGAFTPQGAQAMINAELPLIRGQLVFERIARFAQTFRAIFPQSEYANYVLSALNSINQYRVPALHLHQDSYQKIDSQIRANTGNQKSAGDYFKQVEVLLSNTQQMLMQIQEMFRRYGTGNPTDAKNNAVEAYKAELDDQIRNIYMENSEGIDILQNQGQQVLRDIANQVKGKQKW